ncbi:hypothetical protein FUU19_22095 [Serratia sp. Lou2A]|uniref:Uncharacterized protein n=1 Tax=Serratia montpellierensis TaxID=2598730 RepID=A0ABS8J7D5_9GAMM|nr:hypothetical protein [Serratia sp. Lou2A]MCC7659880.1 hypothetical protein [Serratia sp. Pon4B]
MSNPFSSYGAEAAQEIVIELIRAGKIHNSAQAKDSFTELLNHYRSELDRVAEENREKQTR